MTDRNDLYRRLQVAHVHAKQADGDARQAALDRGALVDLLVRDGASYREIGRMLVTDDKPDGISGQSVFKLYRRYCAAAGTVPPDLAPGRKAQVGG